MGFFDALLGRSKPAQANLDQLFALSSAAVTLQASMDLQGQGDAAVCFKPASGIAFSDVEAELSAVLDIDGAAEAGRSWKRSDDEYGYQWIVLHSDSLEDVVTKAHMVNASLQDAGFGPQLLCSAFSFTGPDAPLYLIYLYKRGTFYPFAPRSGQRRDNEAELRLRALAGKDLPIEQDVSRWFPLWGMPLD